MGAFIALIIMIILVYFFVQELGLNLLDLGYAITHRIGDTVQSDTTVIFICIVIGSIIAYFLLFRKEK